MKRGKNYKEAAAQVDKNKLYDSKEALALACQISKAKFDETIEVHVRLGVDSRPRRPAGQRRGRPAERHR